MQGSLTEVLELFTQPAFLVKDNVVVWCNATAHALLMEGQSIDHYMDMRLFSLWSRKGTFQTTLQLGDTSYDASVRTTPEGDLFVAAKSNEYTDDTAVALLSASIGLRKPLQIMTGAARELFDFVEDEEEVSGVAAQLNHSIYRLMRLCGQMTDGAELLMHQKTAHRVSTDICSFFQRFAREATALTESRGVKMRFTTTVSPAMTADIDRDLIQRALYNLTANALAFTPRGGEITLSLERMDRVLLVTMTDNGEGISKGVAANLFHRFDVHSVGDSRWGLGLGLPMVREIVRLHDGNLTVSDNPEGKGTVVSFTLALTPAVFELYSRTVHYNYCSDFHPGLVELSDVLDSGIYNPTEVL